MESALVVAQRAAIEDARARFAREDISLDTFRAALDALTQARTPQECQAILDALPLSPRAALAALDPAPSTAPAPIPAPTAVAVTRGGERKRRIVAFMSEVNKTRRPWALAPQTDTLAFMGAVRLDLRRAQLPPVARLRVRAVMAEVVVYVPTDVEVSVRSTATMSEVNALGESVAGVIAFGQEEHTPAGGAARARLEIEVSAVMGAVRIRLADEASLTIADYARETLRLAMEGIARGLQSGAGPPAPALPPRVGERGE